jgi:hypothetical protein
LLFIIPSKGFLAELLLPVAFMALLIAIKNITNVYDSPNVAYYCGNAYPWFYSSALDTSGTSLLDSVSPLLCTQKPDTCHAENYYQSGFSYTYKDKTVSGYTEYGYIDSPASSGISENAFYTYTVADESNIYEKYDGYKLENPSLPFCVAMRKVSQNDAILAIAPSSSSDSSLTSTAGDLLVYLQNYCKDEGGYYDNSIIYFNSENNLNDYMTSESYDDDYYGSGKVAFAIVLNSANIQASQWDYSIRVNYTGPFDQDDPTVACLYGGGSCPFRYSIPTTKFYTFDLLKPQQSDSYYGYSYTGFLTLQQVVDQYILKFVNGHSKTRIMESIGLMPTESFESDDFQYVIASTLGIFYMLSFLYPVSRIIRGLVLEKEFRIKEGMKMMGLTDMIYNSSWAITTVLQMTVVSILITLVSSTTVFAYSNKFFVFLYFEVFSLAVINMCFLLATMFSRSKTASLLGPMIFFAAFFPYYAVNDPQFDESSKAAACLLAPACFALGANVFADYEGGLVGVQANNVNQETSNFTYNLCIGMLFFDVVWYGVLAWYLDKVFPSEFGTSLPFYFPFLPSYWCGSSSGGDGKGRKYRGNPLLGWIYRLFGWNSYHRLSISREVGENDAFDNEADLLEDLEAIGNDPKKSQYFENVSSELRQQIHEEKCVSIRKLRKVFKNPAGGSDRIAVEGLNLDLFQNQVTVLLGHNGAGKTTTISMLVGMIPPTSGTAVLPGGLNINDDMASIRRGLGVCPQHDILFPDLTALQHLQVLFGLFPALLLFSLLSFSCFSRSLQHLKVFYQVK